MAGGIKEVVAARMNEAFAAGGSSPPIQVNGCWALINMVASASRTTPPPRDVAHSMAGIRTIDENLRSTESSHPGQNLQATARSSFQSSSSRSSSLLHWSPLLSWFRRHDSDDAGSLSSKKNGDYVMIDSMDFYKPLRSNICLRK